MLYISNSPVSVSAFHSLQSHAQTYQSIKDRALDLIHKEGIKIFFTLEDIETNLNSVNMEKITVILSKGFASTLVQKQDTLDLYLNKLIALVDVSIIKEHQQIIVYSIKTAKKIAPTSKQSFSVRCFECVFYGTIKYE